MPTAPLKHSLFLDLPLDIQTSILCKLDFSTLLRLTTHSKHAHALFRVYPHTILNSILSALHPRLRRLVVAAYYLTTYRENCPAEKRSSWMTSVVVDTVLSDRFLPLIDGFDDGFVALERVAETWGSVAEMASAYACFAHDVMSRLDNPDARVRALRLSGAETERFMWAFYVLKVVDMLHVLNIFNGGGWNETTMERVMAPSHACHLEQVAAATAFVRQTARNGKNCCYIHSGTAWGLGGLPLKSFIRTCPVHWHLQMGLGGMMRRFRPASDAHDGSPTPSVVDGCEFRDFQVSDRLSSDIDGPNLGWKYFDWIYSTLSRRTHMAYSELDEQFIKLGLHFWDASRLRSWKLTHPNVFPFLVAYLELWKYGLAMEVKGGCTARGLRNGPTSPTYTPMELTRVVWASWIQNRMGELGLLSEYAFHDVFYAHGYPEWTWEGTYSKLYELDGITVQSEADLDTLLKGYEERIEKSKCEIETRDAQRAASLWACYLDSPCC